MVFLLTLRLTVNWPKVSSSSTLKKKVQQLNTVLLVSMYHPIKTIYNMGIGQSIESI